MIVRALALLLVCPLALGCAALSDHVPVLPAEPDMEPPPDPEAETYARAEGSLWSGDVSRRFLAFENRAKRVGDLVTVLIAENAVANSEATTDLEGTREFDASVNSDIALQTLITRPIIAALSLLGFTDRRTDKNPTSEVSVLDASTETKFEGEGTTEREATFTTTIACIVTEVTPSGLLRLQGERHLTINEERQVIHLEGYVRPEDVQLDNTVSSSLVANADIRYGGRGVVSDKQRVPILTRLLEWALPF